MAWPQESTEVLERRDMYGGAIELQLPPRFQDVSDFRPVPDHQEVWADAGADESLVLEIVEHADQPDEACANFYWHDVVTSNESPVANLGGVQRLGPEDLPNLQPPACSYACLLSGQLAASKGRQGQHAANLVAVHMAVLRLPQVGSDLLVTLHSPVVIAQDSQAAESAGAGSKEGHVRAAALLRRVLKSLRVNDWGLFG